MYVIGKLAGAWILPKPIYNVEETSWAIILSLYMSVRGN